MAMPATSTGDHVTSTSLEMTPHVWFSDKSRLLLRRHYRRLRNERFEANYMQEPSINI